MQQEQNTAPARLIGLEKAIEDPGTGAPVAFHAPQAYQVMLLSCSCAVTMGSWVSREAHAAGKKPLAHVSLTIKEMPTGTIADAPQWFLQRLLELDGHLLAGAAAVRETLPAGAAEVQA